MSDVLNPFGESKIENYDHLFSEFGLKPIDSLLSRLPNPHRLFRRKIVIAHRDFDKLLDAYEKNEKFAIMSGIKPSSAFHLGSKMVAEEIIYFQKEFKAQTHYTIADLESLVDNKTSLETAEENAIDNVADLLALGLDYKKTFIYRQSQQQDVKNMAFKASNFVTNNMLKAIYGDQQTGLYFAALTQVGDIILPQLDKFGGKKIVVVPVGFDQDPHMRLTRDISKKMNLVPPGSTYHKFMRNLSGGAKMSKRDPLSMLTMNDLPEVAKKKIMRSFTGGRETVEEQKKLGGRPEICMIFELANFHFVEDDKALEEISATCKSGARTCGECKAQLAEIVCKTLTEHQLKKEKLVDKAKEIVGQTNL
ncbi:MAG: tryptophan--tRNA ligase [Candidatus Diapherotrites archaeon]|nr:tryptophan--tRNA ligase [Candidatus Diapherotrites archaeon]